MEILKNKVKLKIFDGFSLIPSWHRVWGKDSTVTEYYLLIWLKFALIIYV